MSVGYILVNRSKKEWISFAHIPTTTAKELAGNPVGAAITTWYLLENRGDQIAFVSDDPGDWPFQTEEPDSRSDYTDVTEAVVNSLIAADILVDDGIAWADESEPQTVYMRALRNKCMEP